MRKKALTALFFCVFFIFGTFTVSASENTTYTYTISTSDKWIRTQDAYLPGNIYLREVGLTQPEDIFIKSGLMYIADAGNRRIVVYEIKTGEYRSFGEDILQMPTGIFVTDNGDIYVADQSAPAVYIFNNAGVLKKTIGRPTGNLFSDLSDYTPKNVVVTKEGSIYVCSANAYEGLLQFSSDGEFEGYFGANRKYLTFKETVEDLLYNDKMRQDSLMRRPRTVYNLDISDRNFVYTATQTGEYNTEYDTFYPKEENCIKQYNLAGVNILSKDKFMNDAWNFTDVAAGKYGNVFGVTQTGLIYEYDSQGEVIFSFGGRVASGDRNGLFTYATAIETDDDGLIYVLDKEKGFVEVFYPTDFAIKTHQAIYDLENGDYEASEESWAYVLNMNAMAKNAQRGYGRVMFHRGELDEAMKHFKLAGDKEYYSEAFWQVRDNWLNKNMIYFLILLILFVVYVIVSSFLKRKKPKKAASYIKKIPTAPGAKFAHDMTYGFYMLKRPVDGYYYIRNSRAGTVITALILYILIFAVYMADTLGRGFIFAFDGIDSNQIFFMSAVFILLCVLFVIGNYLVSSINEGEGSIKKIFIMLPYALSPYLVITPFMVIATHILTQNEAFLITLAWIISLCWSAVLIFIGLREIHNYDTKETVKNVLLTLFFMIIAIVVMAIVYLLWSQVTAFIKNIWMEVQYRVQ